MRGLHEPSNAQSNLNHEPLQESKMKKLAIVAGVVFLVAAVAGFTGMFATLPMYNIVLAVAGVLFITFGIANRPAIIEPRGPGRDLRDLGGV